MMHYQRFFALALPGLVCAVMACAGAKAPKGQDLLMAKCISCHSNLITCTNLGQDKAYWQKTVARMVDKGMEMDQEEQKIVSIYLAELAPGAEPVCK